MMKITCCDAKSLHSTKTSPQTTGRRKSKEKEKNRYNYELIKPEGIVFELTELMPHHPEKFKLHCLANLYSEI